MPVPAWLRAAVDIDTTRHLVAGLTGLLDLTGWPQGMRMIVRKAGPHPGAQLRFTLI